MGTKERIARIVASVRGVTRIVVTRDPPNKLHERWITEISFLDEKERSLGDSFFLNGKPSAAVIVEELMRYYDDLTVVQEGGRNWKRLLISLTNPAQET